MLGSLARGYPASFGPFVLLERIGEGSTGLVDLARPRDPSLGFPPLLVVKRLHVHLAEKKSFVRRFRHEGLLAISVDDPRVARVYDVGRVQETFYLAIEYVPGWKLQTMLNTLARQGSWPSLPSVVSLAVSGLLGAHALHEAKHPRSGSALQAVHRDLSPNNLLVGPDGVLRVIDVGLGKSEAQDWRTKTGAIVGSLGYISPEQIRAESVDRRSDLFSLAVVLHELLTLRPFIPRGERAAMLTASAQPRFTAPSKVRPDLPPALDACLEQALSFSPKDRQPDCKTLADELIRIVPGSQHPALDLGQLVAADPEVQALKRVASSTKVHPTVDDTAESEGDATATEIYARRPAPPPVPPMSTLPDEEDIETPTTVGTAEDGATQVATRVASVSQPDVMMATRVEGEADATRVDGGLDATRVDQRVATKVVDQSQDVRVIPVTSLQAPFAHMPSSVGPKRWAPLLGLLVLVPVTAIISVMVDRALRKEPTAEPTPIRIEAPQKVTPSARPQAQPQASPSPQVETPTPNVPEPAPPPRRAPPRRVRTPPANTAKAPPPPPPPAKKAEPFDAQREIRLITRRARALAESQPALANRANKLIADVSMWAASNDEAQTRKALADAKRTLRMLEKNPG